MSAYNIVQNDGFVIGYSYYSLDRPTAKKYNGTIYFTWRNNIDGNVTSFRQYPRQALHLHARRDKKQQDRERHED